MNIFKYAFTILSTAAVAFGGEVEELVSNLSSINYELRHESLETLKSKIGEVTVEGAEEDRVAYQSTLIELLNDEATPMRSKVHLTRVLALMADESAIAELKAIAADVATDSLLADNAIMAISSIPGSVATETIVSGIEEGLETNATAWWSALSYRPNEELPSDFFSWVKKLDPLPEQAILALGKVGGKDANKLLYSAWKKAEEGNRLALEQAILNSNYANEKALMALFSGGANDSIRTGAFRQLISVDEKESLELFQMLLDGEAQSERALAIRAALGAEESPFWEAAFTKLNQLDTEEIQTVFKAVSDNGMTCYEAKVIEQIDSEDTAVAIAAIDCLGAIGTPLSSKPLLAKLETEDETMKESAIQALAKIQDATLDEEMLKLAATDGESSLAAINILSIRNNKGAVELINELLYEGVDGEKLKACMEAVFKIGNKATCKILTTKIITETDKSARRKLQSALKKLSGNMQLNDVLWDEVYHPALLLASQTTQQTSIIEILDGISSDGALDYCLELLETTEDKAVEKAINQVFNRWRGFNITDHLVAIVTDQNSSEKEVKAASKAIIRLLKAEYTQKDKWARCQLAGQIFIKVTNEDLQRDLIDYVKTQPKWCYWGFKDGLGPVSSVIKLQDELEPLLK